MVSDQNSTAERRKFPRVKKNYILRFFDKNDASRKFEFSQIENISRGGVCFSSTQHFSEGCEISVEVRTPFTTEQIVLDGRILQCREKVKGLIYANRLQFLSVPPRALDVLEKIEKSTANTRV